MEWYYAPGWCSKAKTTSLLCQSPNGACGTKPCLGNVTRLAGNSYTLLRSFGRCSTKGYWQTLLSVPPLWACEPHVEQPPGHQPLGKLNVSTCPTGLRCSLTPCRAAKNYLPTYSSSSYYLHTSTPSTWFSLHERQTHTPVYTTIGGCTLIYKPPKSQCWLGPQTKGRAPKPKQSHSTPFEPSFTLQARVANANNDSRVEKNGLGHKSPQTAPRTAAGKYSRASS